MIGGLLVLAASPLLAVATPQAAQPMSDAERSRIEQEVRQTVEDYVEALKARDLPKILSFWGDFDDFVHAGDGQIVGDHSKWTSSIAETLPDEWLYWRNSDIHVAVLAPNAAAYTMNFEFALARAGERQEVTGSWTYVFRKTSEGWQVVHSNGTHVMGSSYED